MHFYEVLQLSNSPNPGSNPSKSGKNAITHTGTIHVHALSLPYFIEIPVAVLENKLISTYLIALQVTINITV